MKKLFPTRLKTKETAFNQVICFSDHISMSVILLLFVF